MVDFSFVDSAPMAEMELAKSMIKRVQEPDFDQVRATDLTGEEVEIGRSRVRAEGAVVLCGTESNQEYYVREDGKALSITFWFDIGYDGARPRTYDVAMSMAQLQAMACEAVNYVDKKRKASYKDLGAGI